MESVCKTNSLSSVEGFLWSVKCHSKKCREMPHQLWPQQWSRQSITRFLALLCLSSQAYPKKEGLNVAVTLIPFLSLLQKLIL